MFDRPDLAPEAPAYLYDGTFDGFLCCVFEAFEKKQQPVAILPPNSDDLLAQLALPIETIAQKAARVAASIPRRIGPQAESLLRLSFWTCLENKELHMLDFLRLGYRYGAKAVSMLTHPAVDTLTKAVNFLTRESHLYKGFVRFEDHGGLLMATIEPKNFVLALIAPHFCDRLNGESFLIWDKIHGMALVHTPLGWEIRSVGNLIMPKASAEELAYQKLWQLFHRTIAIEGRINPKLQQNHMPKRYWAHLTEFARASGRYYDDPEPPEGPAPLLKG